MKKNKETIFSKEDIRNILLVVGGTIFLFAVGIGFSFFTDESESGHASDYKEACSNHDWDTAYKIVDSKREKMQSYYVKMRQHQDDFFGDEKDKYSAEYDTAKEKYEEAFRYVVLQEAIVTLEESGENGIMRIVGIAKEHDAEGWLYKELLDVAKKIGDDGLAERFQKIMDGSVSGVEPYE